MAHTWIRVREHARLTTDAIAPDLDRAQISPSAFDWLCRLQAGFGQQGARLVEVENRCWLRLDNHVGVLQTPCGTGIEILPKHHEAQEDPAKSRALLSRLIASALDLPHRRTEVAEVQLFDSPLIEWVMRQFLLALDQLIKRGLRFDYQRVEEEQPFLRGQLDMAKQMRQPPGRQHLFHLRHDLFLPDRPENRLLRLALDKVCQAAQEATNWRLARELAGYLHEIPSSRDVRQDFARWRTDRLMAHYQAVRPWCELVLGQQMPLAIQGASQGISLLFPMEKLFEQHVAKVLRGKLYVGTRLHPQAASEYLCQHDDKGIFQLKPDLLLTAGPDTWVLDTKWKRLNEQDRDKKYGLSQGDFYQMLAYGLKYRQGQGALVLIYPKTDNFTKPLKPFTFSDELELQVWPFDLENDELLGLSNCSIPLEFTRITTDAA
ncbi:McrC family protein [Pseudaeromonas sp. ZJS20]|uniref:McrC family protein n=1 Tax=Pseudaeromonas aegiceratis TaxID=3153928 RepID=UPI00390C6756